MTCAIPPDFSGFTHAEAETMNNRRVDAIYFLAFILVLGVGFAIARSQDGDENAVSVDIPDLSFSGFPTLQVEAPFEFSYAFVRFARPKAPALALNQNTESVRRELRSALLHSSTLVEVEGAAELASMSRPPVERLEFEAE